MKNYLTAFFCAITMLASSCSQPAEEKEKDKIKSAADSFTENYFNFKFADSRKFCTEESAVWLSFLASNMQHTLMRKNDRDDATRRINAPERQPSVRKMK